MSRPLTLNLVGWRAALLLISVCLALEASGRNTDFCKNKKNGLYKNPTDCTKYYQCHNDRFWDRPCGPGTYFSEEMGYCDHKSKVKCSLSTTVATTMKPTKTPDVMTSTTATTTTATTATTTPTTTTTTATTATTTADVTTATTTTTNNNNNNNNTNKMADNKCQRIVCYYTNWGPQQTDDVDGTKCTHIIYAYARLFANKIVTAGHWNWKKEEKDYKALMAKKNSNPNLKVLLSVGGYNVGSKPFTEIVRNKKKREYFIETSIDYLKKHNFDGLDLGWAYPTTRESPPEDRQRFTSLLQELRSAFDEEGAKTGKSPLLLTVAVAPKNSTLIDAAYNIPKLDMYVDFINLMSWDFHGQWEGQTGHNSPLYSLTRHVDDMLNVNYAADYWIKSGASKNKLVIGIPLYARSFALKSNCTGLGAPSDNYGISLTYVQVCDLLQKKGVSKRRIPNQQVPYLVYGKQWVGYDDAESIANKVKFVLAKKYGGVVVWELGQDDYKGTSSCGQGRYPLMTKINQVCRTTT